MLQLPADGPRHAGCNNSLPGAMVMYSKARIGGHPIHPMLIAFPVALYVATVATLLVHVATGDSFWYRVAMWSNISGVVMAAIAAVPGLIDLLNLPRHSRARATGFKHAAFNVLALALFAISAVMLFRNAGGTQDIASGQYELEVAAPLALSILGVLSTLAAGWLGWTLVQTHHVGVKPTQFSRADSDGDIDVDAIDRDQRRMPPTYQETYRTTIRH
jgi:uncharacterized membrane protein